MSLGAIFNGVQASLFSPPAEFWEVEVALKGKRHVAHCNPDPQTRTTTPQCPHAPQAHRPPRAPHLCPHGCSQQSSLATGCHSGAHGAWGVHRRWPPVNHCGNWMPLHLAVLCEAQLHRVWREELCQDHRKHNRGCCERWFLVTEGDRRSGSPCWARLGQARGPSWAVLSSGSQS